MIACSPSSSAASELWNTVIEVLDLTVPAVVARTEVPQLVLGPVCPGNQVAALASDGTGDLLVLYALHLDRGER